MISRPAPNVRSTGSAYNAPLQFSGPEPLVERARRNQAAVVSDAGDLEIDLERSIEGELKWPRSDVGTRSGRGARIPSPVGSALPKRCRLEYDNSRMEPFRVLEHTADIGFEAFGATREEVFANAARALMHLVVDLQSIVPREQVSVDIQGTDPASLLVNWLSEVLFLHDAEGWLFCDYEVRSLRDTSLLATARGEKFDRGRHQAKLLVKAITYHQLALEETAGGWRAQVYVDI